MQQRRDRYHFGAQPEPSCVYFTVWAPEAKSVTLCTYQGNSDKIEKEFSLRLKEDKSGVWELETSELKAGALYKYKIDDKGPFPDPASRYQPFGVHGPSQVVSSEFNWSDQEWTNKLHSARDYASKIIIYEMHIGTFTPEGTYAAAEAKLPYLKELGITAIEILPLADFPGRWNWGYDGVAFYSPARCYGTPEELRRLIDSAHKMGIAVLLDVVYNHFGPDGNYTSCYSPYYFTEKHHTPWGPAPNIDLVAATDEKSISSATQVRRFLIENALYWIEDYHFDGLRLDATHALVDNSTPHFLAQLVQVCNENTLGKSVFIYAEDDRNSTLLLKEPPKGYNLDGAWADDFHHQVRVKLAKDHESYFANFTGSTKDLVETASSGWFYKGQKCGEENRGTDSTEIPLMTKFVYCIQNHDQIGNRAMGDRLNHNISLEAYKAASALFLTLPETPMLFMGQEWASTSPFQFFTDHNPDLGKLVTEGRRKEFAKFSAFNDPALREKIPDPQAESTYRASQLKFNELDQQPHKAMFKFYQALIKLRKRMGSVDRKDFAITQCSENAVVITRKSIDNKTIIAVINFEGECKVNLEEALSSSDKHPSRNFQVLFTSEDEEFVTSKTKAPQFTPKDIVFYGPSAMFLEC